MLKKGEQIDLKSIKNKAGWYKVWVTRNNLNQLLNGLGQNFEELKSYIETKEELYCIYVGKAKNNDGGLQGRLKNHFGSRVDGSTLKKSLSAILAGGKDDETRKKTVNDFMNNVSIEYGYADGLPIPLSVFEVTQINDKLRILNIDCNDLPVAEPIVKKLQELRKKK